MKEPESIKTSIARWEDDGGQNKQFAPNPEPPVGAARGLSSKSELHDPQPPVPGLCSVRAACTPASSSFHVALSRETRVHTGGSQ